MHVESFVKCSRAWITFQVPTGSVGDPTFVIAVVTALVTVVLAIATVYQAYESGKTVKEMKATREAEYTPRLRVFLDIVQTTVVVLRVANIGRAPCLDIDLMIKFEKDAKTVDTSRFRRDSMLPSDFVDLLLPEMDFGQITKKIDSVKIIGEYKDGHGKSFPVNKDISVAEFVGTVKSAKLANIRNVKSPI
ncbi:MAG TPA: hypothetical protein VN739_03050 [Nitrososphaerales archaeon]|nr:hypothetical protein [Nitrososphaerales archaeon]